MTTPNNKSEMSGSMRYVEIGFPRDEGAHSQDPRYGEAAFEIGEKWIEWWYVNGRLKTKNKRNFGYMSAIIHIKNNKHMIKQP